jgi:hypothetical protein
MLALFVAALLQSVCYFDPAALQTALPAICLLLWLLPSLVQGELPL